MKNEKFVKINIKEISLFFIVVIGIIIYLKTPYKEIDKITIDKEIIEKSLNEISLYKDVNVNYFKAYKISFYYTLPLTQIIEYKKKSFIYDLSNINSNKLSEEYKATLVNTKQFYDLEEILSEDSNTQYGIFQFLGVISVLLLLVMIYFILRYKRPGLLNFYYFILIFFYFSNLVFLRLNYGKESSIKKNLKELYINHKLD